MKLYYNKRATAPYIFMSFLGPGSCVVKKDSGYEIYGRYNRKRRKEGRKTDLRMSQSVRGMVTLHSTRSDTARLTMK